MYTFRYGPTFWFFARSRDDQDEDNGDDAPTRGFYPVVPVAPRSALPIALKIARTSDGHQRRRIGDRHFEFNLT